MIDWLIIYDQSGNKFKIQIFRGHDCDRNTKKKERELAAEIARRPASSTNPRHDPGPVPMYQEEFVEVTDDQNEELNYPKELLEEAVATPPPKRPKKKQVGSKKIRKNIPITKRIPDFIQKLTSASRASTGSPCSQEIWRKPVQSSQLLTIDDRSIVAQFPMP